MPSTKKKTAKKSAAKKPTKAQLANVAQLQAKVELETLIEQAMSGFPELRERARSLLSKL